MLIVIIYLFLLYSLSFYLWDANVLAPGEADPRSLLNLSKAYIKIHAKSLHNRV